MSAEQIKEMIRQEVEAFRKEVFAFLERNKIGRTYFGTVAANNPRLVGRLENGEGVQLETIMLVRQFMSDFEAKAKSGHSKQAAKSL